jgi:L-serine dehydratase
VVRIGRVGHRLAGGDPDSVIITFYNSFARTYEGHGSDRAILAGLMDFNTDDVRIKQSLDIAKERNITFTIKGVANASTYHPNTVKLNLYKGGKQIELIGESLGGGVINIAEVDGFKADFRATLHTLVIKAEDVKGSIAFIANVLAHDNCNIATMSVSRKGKHDLACMVIEMDSGIKTITLDYLRSLSYVKEIIYIPDINL